MKTAICYYSRHHGNTMQVLESMAQEQEIDLINVTSRIAAHLEQYDCIGFASGIYYSKFHKTVLDFAEKNLPQGKDVFFLYTCGAAKKGYTASITAAVQKHGARILGEYGCRGFDTFGPFRLVGGIAKGHPTPQEVGEALAFYRSL